MKAYCKKVPNDYELKDTAEEVGNLEDCLYSTGNRVKIAKFLVAHEAPKRLLHTAIEDLFVGVQMIMDEHCIIRDE